MVAVVRGLDLDDALTTGEAARQADRVERRLGAAVGEAPLRLLEAARQLACDDDVLLDRLREMRPAMQLRVDGRDDRRMRMADDHDAEAVVEIDVLVAVDVPDLAALAVVDEDRLRRRVLERARHAAGDELRRFTYLILGHVYRNRTGQQFAGPGEANATLEAAAALADKMARGRSEQQNGVDGRVDGVEQFG